MPLLTKLARTELADWTDSPNADAILLVFTASAPK